MALNGALRGVRQPSATLDAFVQSLGTSEAIRFRRTGTEMPRHPPARGAYAARTACRTGSSSFSAMPEIGASFPVRIEGKQVGDIVFAPDHVGRHL